MIYKIKIFIIVMTYAVSLYSQEKQGNTIGAELFADSPYRMKKNDKNGNINPVPVTFYVHDADGFGFNVQLISIDVEISNAGENNFNRILLNDLDTIAFENCLVNRSPDDTILDIESFTNSGYEADNVHTLIFNADGDIFNNYVTIDRKFWYFTLMIPPEKLINYTDIIDIHVYFDIAWSTNDETYLRVFRYNNDIPKIRNWYRGDTHYHTMFTQNIAETGLPLDATKQAAEYTGLDWHICSDHSCDFDNYGISMNSNWQKLGDRVAQLNASDTNVIQIRGMEMSVNNSQGEIVHALIYPSENDVFSLPYLGDGGGDAYSTSVSLKQLLDNLYYYDAFCYAAHPFAEDDKLPDLINGGIWNISDTGFPENGQAFPSLGTVICNNLNYQSDIYSLDSNYLFNPVIKGGQIWNLYNTHTTKDEDAYYNPWNVNYSSNIDALSLLDANDKKHFMYRLQQNMDVTTFLLQKGLKEKNNNNNILNWKFNFVAGSDAHGSFGYSNTNMYLIDIGTIENNAIGRLSTLIYSETGKGANGEKILHALRKGHTVLSDGPVIVMGIDTDAQPETFEILPGDDTVLTYQQLYDYSIIFNVASNQEFGSIHSAKLYVGLNNEAYEYIYPLPVVQGINSFNLYNFIDDIFLGSIVEDSYFYLRAELTTYKDYGTLNYLYGADSMIFHSLTNPVWIKINNILEDNDPAGSNIQISPNPATTEINVTGNISELESIKVYDLQGKLLESIKPGNHNNSIKISTVNYIRGVYIIKIIHKDFVTAKKVIIE